jgi:ribosome-associated protein
LSVGASLGITDAFVITSATSSRQVRTIAEAVEEKVKAAGGAAPRNVEGLGDARWVLMDFGDFVVHAMLAEARDFYQLDGLWSDAEAWEWMAAQASPQGAESLPRQLAMEASEPPACAERTQGSKRRSRIIRKSANQRI